MSVGGALRADDGADAGAGAGAADAVGGGAAAEPLAAARAAGRPWLLRLGARLLWLYQRAGAQAAARRLGVLRRLPGGLGRMEAQLPRINGGFFGPSRRVYQPETTGDEGDAPPLKVALLSGCVMPLMQAATMRAAVRTLTRNGCQVTVPPGQGCCGALSLHAGDLEAGRRMARRNIDAMLRGGGRPHRDLFRRVRVDDERICPSA